MPSTVLMGRPETLRYGEKIVIMVLVEFEVVSILQNMLQDVKICLQIWKS